MNSEAGNELLADPDAQLRRWKLPVFDGGASGARTAQEVEDIERAAYEEGHKRGYDDGYRAGQEQAVQQAQRLRSLMEHLAKPLVHLDDEVERMLVDLACSVARRVLDAELHIDERRVLELVRSALAVLPEELREVRLYLNPVDAVLVREYLVPPPEITRFRMLDDAQLTRGDCRIQTELLVLDARLDARIEHVRTSLHEPQR